MLAFSAILLTAALLTLLCVGDPKRRRRIGLADHGLTANIRRALAAGATLPGILLAISGDAAAFLLWLGACAAFGWLLALFFAQRPSHMAQRARR